MWNIAALGNVGRKRNVNEDVAALVDLATGWTACDDSLQAALTSSAAVFGIFDGTGTAGPKVTASHIAARIFCEQMASAPPTASAQDLAQRLAEIMRAAGREIRAVNDRSRVGLGTTATVAGVTSNEVLIAHVGDSRAYLLSDGELRQVTRDDTLLSELLDQGEMTPAEIETFPHRNVLTRILGSGGAVEHSLVSLSVRAGDVVLLCTDGIWGLVDEATMAALLRVNRDPEAVCRALVDAAEGAGGPDNETAVVAMFDDPV